MADHDHDHDCDEACTEQRSMAIALIFVTGIIAYAGSIVPWHLKRCFTRSPIDTMNVLAALASGLVFGAFMLHMLPEAAFALQEYASGDPHAGEAAFFPWAHLIVTVTCLLLIAVDRAVVSKGMLGHEDTHSHDHISAAFNAMREDSKAPATTTGTASSGSEEAAAAKAAPSASPTTAIITVSADPSSDKVSSSSSSSPSDGSPSAASIVPHGSAAAPAAPTAREKAHNEAILRAWVFFAALSLHSIFDGLATGMGAGHAHGGEEEAEGEEGGEDAHATRTALAIAVVFHKLFDGIALGVPVYLAAMSRVQTQVILIACALTTPLGIAIGLGTKEALEASEGQTALAEGVILSISGGSFLFISLVELLPSALHDGRKIKTKVAAFALGLLVMAIIAGAE